MEKIMHSRKLLTCYAWCRQYDLLHSGKWYLWTFCSVLKVIFDNFPLCTVGTFNFFQMSVTFLPFDGNGWNFLRGHLGPSVECWKWFLIISHCAQWEISFFFKFLVFEKNSNFMEFLTWGVTKVMHNGQKWSNLIFSGILTKISQNCPKMPKIEKTQNFWDFWPRPVQSDAQWSKITQFDIFRNFDQNRPKLP